MWVMRLAVQLALFPFGSPMGNGAPESSCKLNMGCGGHDTAPIKSAPPYSLTISQNKIGPGGRVIVRLRSLDRYNPGFKGFILYAKPSEAWRDPQQATIGKWRIKKGAHVKHLNCYKGEKSALTQSRPKGTIEVIAQWVAPPGFTGHVTFVATVVRSYKFFWTDITQGYPLEVGVDFI